MVQSARRGIEITMITIEFAVGFSSTGRRFGVSFSHGSGLQPDLAPGAGENTPGVFC